MFVLEQIDTETRNAFGLSSVLSIHRTRDEALAAAYHRFCMDMGAFDDADPDWQAYETAAEDDGVLVEDDGKGGFTLREDCPEEEAIFRYVATVQEFVATPDPEALVRAIAASIAGGVVWENREDWLDVKDAYRDAIELLDDASLLETAAYLLNPEGDDVNMDHD